MHCRAHTSHRALRCGTAALVEEVEQSAPKKRRRSLGASHGLLQSLKAKTQRAFGRHMLDDACRVQLVGALVTVNVAIASL